MTDFLDLDDLSARDAVEAAALEHASKYLVFETDPRAKALLASWVEGIEARDVPPGASHSEFAYWEGRRAFVRGIQREIAKAKRDGK